MEHAARDWHVISQIVGFSVGGLLLAVLIIAP